MHLHFHIATTASTIAETVFSHKSYTTRVLRCLLLYCRCFESAYDLLQVDSRGDRALLFVMSPLLIIIIVSGTTSVRIPASTSPGKCNQWPVDQHLRTFIPTFV